MMEVQGIPPPPVGGHLVLPPFPGSIGGGVGGGGSGLLLEVVPEEEVLDHLQCQHHHPSASTSSQQPMILEEDEELEEEEDFPPPPPPSLLLLPPLPPSSQLQQQPPPSLPPPPPQRVLPPSNGAGDGGRGGGVWSMLLSSSSSSASKGGGGGGGGGGGNRNNEFDDVIKFYLEQVLSNTKEVIAFICGLIVFLLMILCLASPDWLLADKFRQGLWVHCISENAPLPLPFNLTERGGCFTIRPMGYIQASAAFCVICLLFDVGATAMTGVGLYTKDPVLKYRLYRYALYAMIAALVSILLSLIIYPSCFSGEIEVSNRRLWEFGWAYGVGWGAAIFLFGAVVLLLCDKETEEIYYKERTIVHDNNESKA